MNTFYVLLRAQKIRAQKSILTGMTLALLLIGISPLAAQTSSKKPLDFVDMMHFKGVGNTTLAADGSWMGWTEKPDRGDGSAILQSLNSDARFELERGNKIDFSWDARWAAVTIAIPYSESIKDSKKKAKPGRTLVDLERDTMVKFDSVQYHAFARDSRWLALQFHKTEPAKKSKNKDSSETETENDPADTTANKDDEAEKEDIRGKNAGSRLLLIDLQNNRREFIEHVTRFAFDSSGTYLAYAVADSSGKKNGLFVKPLNSAGEGAILPIQAKEYLHFGHLNWNNASGALAYLACPEDSNEHINVGEIMLWKPGNAVQTLNTQAQQTAGYVIPFKNSVNWTRDGERLYFGLMRTSRAEIDRLAAIKADKDKEVDSTGMFVPDSIRKDAGLSVWHWRDSVIATQQRKLWKRVTDYLFDAVYHVKSDRVVQLADETMAAVQRPENGSRTLGYNDTPYLRATTWAGWFNDVYSVDLHSGERTMLFKNFVSDSDHLKLAPNGQHLAYYKDSTWFLLDLESGRERNVTGHIKTPFYNVDHDYPRPAPAYGIAGWTTNDAAVLIYDQFDIWQFPVNAANGSKGERITKNGREKSDRYRFVNTDSLRVWIDPNESQLLGAFNERKKNSSFHQLTIKSKKLKKLLGEDKRYRFVSKAPEADRIAFKKERFDEFPDLWIAGMDLQDARRISNGQEQLQEYQWGSSELVEWNSQDGKALQGVLIKPANYDSAKKYPVIVYFYRLWSWRLHSFWRPRINDGLNASYYASNGYCVFIPDVRFEVGYPGPSAVRCIVPGVQKLIDMGVADPKRVGITGHSWSGYQTSYIITQSDIFAAALAGAPVSNMTSAYSGIRLGSGLARQFQYEHFQSRIGGSLWEYPLRYIENSPVFYADRVNTPLLIMFGDVDDAVPYPQGIELYLALRRFNKPCVMLQYYNEPHHLKKFENQMDYDIRVREFFDHFLQSAEAPEWWRVGEAYKGK